MKAVLFFLLISTTSLYSITNSLEWKKTKVWTNKDGETFQGSLESATTSSVRVLSNGKTFKISMRDLSEEDVTFVKGYLMIKPVEVSANSSKWTHNKRRDARAVDVEVNGVAGRELTVSISWIGDDGNKSRYGVFKTESKKIRVDGKVSFDVVYPDTKKKFDKNYRGFAVKVTGQGIRVGETASQVPFIRFLKNEGNVKKPEPFYPKAKAQVAEKEETIIEETGKMVSLPSSSTYQMVSCNDRRWTELSKSIICKFKATSKVAGKKLYLQIFVDSFKNSQTRGKVVIKNHSTGEVLKTLSGIGRGSSPKIELGVEAQEEFEVSITNGSGDGLRIAYYKQEGDQSTQNETPHVLLIAE